ncbi:MAG: membrane protein [Flavobacteriaceae bacterium]|jgi:membrane protein|uniref:YihY/virulence factor BrkB family protein n=1 Tax=Candidatus Marifrigoribacter sp. Uisw_064 TaxID=3230970 RepID=UPI003AD843E9
MKGVEKILLKIPVIRQIILICKKIKLPGFGGLSLFDLIKSYVFGIIEGTFSTRAGSIAFSFFMALFPFLLFLLNLIPFVPIENFNETFLLFIEGILPPQTTEFFLPIIEDIAANPRGGLLSVVFIIAIFLMSNGINAIFSGFEYSYHVTINRNFIKQYFVALVVSVFLALMLLVTVIIIVYSEYIIGSLKSEDFISNDFFWISTIRYIIFVVLVYMVIAILYYYGIKEGKSIRFFSIGALVTTLMFMLTTYLFGIYIENFSNYNELYGSIGALLIMMLYIWINSNLLLLGFELNATLKTLKNRKC